MCVFFQYLYYRDHVLRKFLLNITLNLKYFTYYRFLFRNLVYVIIYLPVVSEYSLSLVQKRKNKEKLKIRKKKRWWLHSVCCSSCVYFGYVLLWAAAELRMGAMCSRKPCLPRSPVSGCPLVYLFLKYRLLTIISYKVIYSQQQFVIPTYLFYYCPFQVIILPIKVNNRYKSFVRYSWYR